MMRKTRIVPLTVCVAALLSGCGRRPAECGYLPISANGWGLTDTLTFRTDTLPAGRYSLTLGLRTSASVPYPYRSLTLLLRQTWEQTNTARCDTIVCPLTTIAGDLSGKGIAFFQYEFSAGTFCLQKPTAGRLSVSHIMRREILPGITDVGFRIDRIDRID